MTHFHGTRRKRTYFEGWYLKQQCGPYSLALNPRLSHRRVWQSIRIDPDHNPRRLRFRRL